MIIISYLRILFDYAITVPCFAVFQGSAFKYNYTYKNNKKQNTMAKEVTKRSDNYSQWYDNLVVKADLAERSAVRGCMVIKPYGYATVSYTHLTLPTMAVV